MNESEIKLLCLLMLPEILNPEFKVGSLNPKTFDSREFCSHLAFISKSWKWFTMIFELALGRKNLVVSSLNNSVSDEELSADSSPEEIWSSSTTICREAKLWRQINMLVLRTSNFQTDSFSAETLWSLLPTTKLSSALQFKNHIELLQ